MSSLIKIDRAEPAISPCYSTNSSSFSQTDAYLTNNSNQQQSDIIDDWYRSSLTYCKKKVCFCTTIKCLCSVCLLDLITTWNLNQ